MILNTQIHKPRSTDVKRESETTTDVAAQKAVESHNEVQKQKHQQQDNDSHNVSETTKIETYKNVSKKSEATEEREI